MISTTGSNRAQEGLDQALAATPDIKLLDFQVAELEIHRSLRPDRQPAHALRRPDQGHLGGERRHGRRRARKRCAPRAWRARFRSSAWTGSSRPSMRCAPASSPARVYLRSLLAGRDGPLHRPRRLQQEDRSGEGAFEHREFYGKAVLIAKDNVEDYYKTNRRGEADARLERSVGTSGGPHPPELSRAPRTGRARGLEPCSDLKNPWDVCTNKCCR